MRSLLLLGILILNVGAIAAADSPIERWNRENVPKPFEQPVERITLFADQFAEAISVEHMSKSFVFSPTGAALAVSMASFGARESTASSLEKCLGLPDSTSLKEERLQSIVDDLNNYTATGLEVTSTVFLSSKYELIDDFNRSIVTAFGSPVQRINFENLTKSSEIINAWCSKTSHNCIQSTPYRYDQYEYNIRQNVRVPDPPDNSPAFVPINTLYFKGKWLHEFSANETRIQRIQCFWDIPQELKWINTTIAAFTGELENPAVKFIQLPYKTENDASPMSMFIIQPKTEEDQGWVATHIANITIESLLNSAKPQTVLVDLPQFRIEYEYQMAGIMSMLDVLNPFDKYSANFSGIFTSDLDPLFMDDITQTVIIEINDKGTEAAAVTAISGTHTHHKRDELSVFDLPTREDLCLVSPVYFIIGTTGAHPMHLFTGRFVNDEI